MIKVTEIRRSSNNNLNNNLNNTETITDLNNNITSQLIDNVNSQSGYIGSIPLTGGDPIDTLTQEQRSELIKLLEFYRDADNNTSYSESFPNLISEARDSAGVIFSSIRQIYEAFHMNNLNDLPENIQKKLTDLITKMINSNTNLSEAEKVEYLRPFGDMGDITVNEIFTNLMRLDYGFIISNYEVIINPITMIPMGLLYGGIVRLYARSVDPESRVLEILNEQRRMEANRARITRMRRFMLGWAPVLTLGLILGSNYGMNNVIRVNRVIPSSLESSNENTLGLIGFMRNKYFKYTILIIILLCGLIYLMDIDIISLALTYIKYKHIVIMGIIVLSILSIEVLLESLLYYLYNRQVIIKSKFKHLPTYVNNRLNTIKILSLYKEEYKHSIKMIIFQLLIGILLLIHFINILININ